MTKAVRPRASNAVAATFDLVHGLLMVGLLLRLDLVWYLREMTIAKLAWTSVGQWDTGLGGYYWATTPEGLTSTLFESR